MGTTTLSRVWCSESILYHYERKLGTTTIYYDYIKGFLLYHYERKLGTTTVDAAYQYKGKLCH